jgi:hypothetical protein
MALSTPLTISSERAPNLKGSLRVKRVFQPVQDREYEEPCGFSEGNADLSDRNKCYKRIELD